MVNKNYYDAAVMLFNNMSRDEAKRFMNYMSNSKADLMSEVSFSTLKKSSAVFGGVGRCINLLPLGIYIEGWFLPTNNYDTIEIYCGDRFLGNARLNVQRIDVYNNFSFYNEKNAGFNFLCMNPGLELSTDRKISVVLKKNGRTVNKYIKTVEGISLEDSICNLQENIRENNNILVPTLTNRIPMILKIAQNMPDYNFVTLMEGMENNLSAVFENCKNQYNIDKQTLDVLTMNMVPTLFFRNMSVGGWQVELSDYEKEIYANNDAVKCASENFSTKYNTSLSYAIKYCCCAIQYAEKVIENIKPRAVLIWNKYSPWHSMLEIVAGNKGIPVVFMENGLLPGTLIFETGGQMGESEPAVNAEEFKKLAVSADEIENAFGVKEQLYANKLNRWTSTDASVYVKSEKDVVLEKIKEGRPIILYAGQNDFESGLFPYTEHTKKYHSPIFESSEEAAIYLAKLAEKNDWNFIYKRHPMMRGKMISKLPDSAIISDNIDIHDAIDMADLTITILSQTSYVAMIRNKPALMLGYHQIREKGCAYEVTEKNEIEKTIADAIENGFTEEQKNNFNMHIAQLCKYYLYRDFTNQDIQYGKTLKDLVLFLDNLICADNGKKSEVIYNTVESANEEIAAVVKEQNVSEFRLELSLKERFERKTLKKNLGKCTDDSESLRKLMDYENPDNWYKDMMFIAQFDDEFLKTINWDKKFIDLIAYMYREGKLTFVSFVERVEKLHDEIKKRLHVRDNFVAFVDEILQKDAGTYLDIMTDEGNSEFAKNCLEYLRKYYQECNDEMQENIIGQINQNIADKSISNRQKVYLLEWLWDREVFTSEHTKLFIETLLSATEDDLLIYYGVMELDRITFLKPECKYPDYYNDRRKFIQYAAETVMGEDEYVKNNEHSGDGANRKIAMLVTGLHGKRFASTRLQVGLANELSKRNYDVTIFVTDTNYANEKVQFLVPPKTIRRNFSKTIYKMDHCVMLDTGVNVRYFIDDTSAKERYQKVIQQVREYDPMVIIDITNENAVYNPILCKTHKVISIPLNGYSSSSVFDGYIARNLELLDIDNKIYKSLENISCLKEANLYLPYDIPEDVYNREKHGFRNDDYLIVTVGNRLDYEITDTVQKTMNGFLEEHPNAKWVLVGTIGKELEYLRDKISSGQVKKWGYENQLPSLYKMCDVYLDLPRSGGGGSVACAVQSGIPAIVVDMPSDIMPFLGKKTSTKDWNDSLEVLVRLQNNKREKHNLAKKQFVNLMSKKWSVENFVDVIELTIDELI